MIKYDKKTNSLTISYPLVTNDEDMFKALASHLMSSSKDEWLQCLGSDIWQCLTAGENDDN